MRITIQKSDIAEVLSQIQGLTGRKTSLAITENVLLQTDDNGIRITATDLESGFEGFFPAEVEADGAIAINSRKFYEIVRNFPTEAIYVSELENNWIEISCENVEYHIVGMDPDEFPDTPKIEEVEFFTIESPELKKMIEKTVSVGVAGDEKRAHLIGVNMEKIDSGSEEEGAAGRAPLVRMVSTDIKRLAMVEYQFDPESGFTGGDTVIIPKKGLGEVNKFLSSEGRVQVGVKDNYFIVKKENETVSVKLLNGAFPAYSELLSIDHEFDIVFDRNLLLMMLKRMSILTSEEYRGVIFHFENNQLIMRTVNAALGESKETMNIEYDRDPQEIAFNPRYFIDALNFINTEKVLLNVKNEDNPCIVRAENDLNYLNIIMPMKI
ncbi:MAG: DNA polymerase III subunit beta [Desulfobacteraceae bacterium]|nr:DNA polymerase III subunit beta [Desulfobacteraceae bacterium]